MTSHAVVADVSEVQGCGALTETYLCVSARDGEMADRYFSSSTVFYAPKIASLEGPGGGGVDELYKFHVV